VAFKALQLFHSMSSKKLHPDLFSYNATIRCLAATFGVLASIPAIIKEWINFG